MGRAISMQLKFPNGKLAWLLRLLRDVALLTCMLQTVWIPLVHAQAAQAAVSDVDNELLQVRQENGLIREQLRKIEEQQRTLLQVVGELQRRIDGQAPRLPANRRPPMCRLNVIPIRRLRPAGHRLPPRPHNLTRTRKRMRQPFLTTMVLYL